MAEGILLVVTLVIGFVGFVFGIVLNHFWPLFINIKLGHVPKGTFGWPLLGETLSFLKPHPSNSIGNFLQEHCSRYGKVFKSHLFFSPTVVSCDQDLNYFILQNEDKLFQCSYPKPIHGILGKVSLLVAVGDTHKRLRNVSLSLISTIKSKPEFINDVEKSAIQILQSWKNKKQVSFWEESRKFSFNVIVKQVLGLTPEDPQSATILQDFLAFMRGLISLPLYIPGTPYARAVQARSRISSTVKAIIEERRRRNDGGSCCSDDSKRNDFLEILLCVDTLSEDEKVSFVLDSLLGGYETTSLLMAMVVFFVGQSQVALDQLKVEHHNVRSMKKKKELLNWEDYKKMDFTQKVINEALRYGNVVKFVHRKALKDVKFRDYVIPAGWKVLPVFSAVHLDPSVHANALQFNPWRWESDEQICKKLTPFGGGSRCCPGFELAKVEVAFFLHHLVQKYRWDVEEGEQPIAYPYVEFQRGLTIRLHQIST
ncbi:PREDICTED: cytochrome P450 724B1-like [Nicotiana attenuata]|uniref:Cytochrome P450 724B1 n=1 Tax=Nicotiana attenuata TaxID=49451 RepID=A0A314KRQ7_NICAT|nr:PREDICTED: cytochrome P450 724B1-like [Nicotiana attenuata]OIT32038.1 cytochrome p450 724b1 [Nicotiana attenuata]